MIPAAITNKTLRRVLEKCGAEFEPFAVTEAKAPDKPLAYYNWGTDKIGIKPNIRFSSPQRIAVVLHELIHWTGPRLRRNPDLEAPEEILASDGAIVLGNELFPGNARIIRTLVRHNDMYLASAPAGWVHNQREVTRELGTRAAEYIIRCYRS